MGYRSRPEILRSLIQIVDTNVQFSKSQRLQQLNDFHAKTTPIAPASNNDAILDARSTRLEQNRAARLSMVGHDDNCVLAASRGLDRRHGVLMNERIFVALGGFLSWTILRQLLLAPIFQLVGYLDGPSALMVPERKGRVWGLQACMVLL